MRRTRLLQMLAISVAVMAIVSPLVACGGDGATPISPTSTTTPASDPITTATGTAPESAEAEVAAAYLTYWDVYAAADLNLDDSNLGEVMTGPMLERTRQEIADLRQRGRAAKIEVDHNFFVATVDQKAGTATVVDEYLNRSYEVDANTKQAVGGIPAATKISDTYFLTWTGDTWKVRDGVRSTTH